MVSFRTASRRPSSPLLLWTCAVEDTAQPVSICWIDPAVDEGRRWLIGSIELESEDGDDVGNIDVSIVVCIRCGMLAMICEV